MLTQPGGQLCATVLDLITRCMCLLERDCMQMLSYVHAPGIRANALNMASGLRLPWRKGRGLQCKGKQTGCGDCKHPDCKHVANNTSACKLQSSLCRGVRLVMRLRRVGQWGGSWSVGWRVGGLVLDDAVLYSLRSCNSNAHSRHMPCACSAHAMCALPDYRMHVHV